MQCIADMGTQLNIIPKSCIRHHALQATSVELTAYGGDKLTVVGTCILPVAYKNMNTTARFYVVETQASDKPLLSTELCEALGLLNDLIQSSTTANVKRSTRFGHIKNKEYKISIDETVLPVRIPPQHVPPALLSPISAKLKEMENADIIRPVHDFKWSSPLVPVVKKNGDVRICADFRELNKAIRREPFQIPSIEDIFMQLNGATIFQL